MRWRGMLTWAIALFVFPLALPPTLAFAAEFDFVTLFTDNRAPNTFAPGWRLLVDADIRDPLGLSDILSVTATPTKGSNLPNVTLLFDPPAPPPAGVFSFDNALNANTWNFANTSYHGQYQIDVTTQNSGTFSILTHNLDNIQQLPLPTNLAVNNNSTAPVFSFTQPTGVTLPTGYELRDQFRIIDPNGNIVFNTGLVSAPPPGGEFSFQVPPGLLDVGATYNLQARVWEVDTLDNPPGPVSNRENRSFDRISFTPTVSAPEPPASGLLAFGLALMLGFGWFRRRGKFA